LVLIQNSHTTFLTQFLRQMDHHGIDASRSLLGERDEGDRHRSGHGSVSARLRKVVSAAHNGKQDTLKDENPAQNDFHKSPYGGIRGSQRDFVHVDKRLLQESPPVTICWAMRR